VIAPLARVLGHPDERTADRPASSGDPSGRASRPTPVVAAVGVAGAVAAAVLLAQVVRAPHATLPLMDLTAYRIGGWRVLSGVPLYGLPLIGATRGVFEFVYPPFAALLFAPLAAAHGATLVVVGLVVGVGLTGVVVALSLRGLGTHRSGTAGAGRTLCLAAGATGLLLWCEPVYQTVTFGQVNLLVAALVLVDVVRPASARTSGAFIGIAAGIKLTPLFFVAYLLVTRRFRAAAVACGAFLATAAVGAVLLPGDSRTFWSGAFADPARIGVPEHPGNQSLRGLIARGLGVGPGISTAQQGVWLVGALAVAALGLVVARRLSRRGAELGAVTVCGLTATAVSPYSWVHHWVWFAPLLILLADRAVRRRSPGAWATLLGVAAVGSHWFFSGFGLLPAPPDAPVGDLPRVSYQHGYVLLTAALLVAAYRVTRRRGIRLAR
jgi:alpha-1,2-mannosyltransferase